MRHPIFCILALTVSLGAGCADIERPTRRGSTHQKIDLPTVPENGGSAPGEVTEPTAEDGGIALLAPPLPTGVSAVPLTAQLSQAGRLTGTITSQHADPAAAALTPVSAGTYTLTFLDADGQPTEFSQPVTVSAGANTIVRIGTVVISEGSAVQSERVGIQSIPFTIGDGLSILKTVILSINTAIDVPQGTLQWSGQGVDGALPPMSIATGNTIETVEFGSILVRRNTLDTVQIRSDDGTTLITAAADGVEYLLPTFSDNSECMVYLGVLNLLASETFTMCAAGETHFIFDVR